MREIISIVLFFTLITFSLTSVVAADAGNIAFGEREEFNEGWGSFEEDLMTLSANNDAITVAGGEGYDFEIRIISSNHDEWRIVATGNIPTEGIEFTLFYQFSYQGSTHVFRTTVFVTGEGSVPIRHDITGTGPDSMNEVNVIPPILGGNNNQEDDEEYPGDYTDPGNGTDPENGNGPGNGTEPENGNEPGNGTEPENGNEPGNGTEPENGNGPGNGTEPENGNEPGNGTDPENGNGSGNGNEAENGTDPEDNTEPENGNEVENGTGPEDGTE
ncbi:MAG: hypothetical protein FWE58_06275, partial [Methanobrevibacter sp.]|nr:hypothetical protein [Methanobrevibacter sp.]